MLKLLDFWTLAIVWCSKKWRARRVDNWMWFRPRVKIWQGAYPDGSARKSCSQPLDLDN